MLLNCDALPIPARSASEGQPTPARSASEGQSIPARSASEGQPIPARSASEGQPIPARSASFDVALFCFFCPNGAVTSKPRATPWVTIQPCKNITTLPPHMPYKGATISDVWRPDRARIPLEFPWSQGVALGWLVAPLRGVLKTAQHQKAPARDTSGTP